jgi:phosphopantothenoylcysteine decarboxylase/phosphopantothenate--cysteine ligase
MFDPSAGTEIHIELGCQSDLIVIAPATADLVARLATGRASDLVSTVALCARCPLVVAPAMHPSMWSHPATQRNVSTLLGDGRVELAGPVQGPVASGEVGLGRMLEPESLVSLLRARLGLADLAGRHIVVTAGPTVEDIDPVRFITNRSSGKMGFSVAERAAVHGAQVTLIAGPVALPTPVGVQRLDVRSAADLRAQLWHVLGPDLAGADAVVMAAAVGDYRPASPSAHKLRRSSAGEPLHLELQPNEDIIAEVGQVRQAGRPLLIGFSVDTRADHELVTQARKKLERKGLDLIVANRADEAFGGETNRAALISSSSADWNPSETKTDLGERIVCWLAQKLGGPD